MPPIFSEPSPKRDSRVDKLSTWYSLTPELSHSIPGRFAELAGAKEETSLKGGLDFRLPQYRREVFLRFYEFHLKYRTHPGCVYFLLPELIETLGLSPEESYWLAYVNGNTQNPVTSYQAVTQVRSLKDTRRLSKWFNDNYSGLAFDTDRRYQKKVFLDAVGHYLAVIGSGTQEDFFSRLAERGWVEIFKTVKKFAHFGRLSTWSYLEYLRIIGLDIAPSDLMLRDLSGSKSHRNGLARVLGRDDLDWHASNPTRFAGQYSPAMIEWLEGEALALLGEARHRSKGTDWERDVNNFTLESALCTFKSWHRPNRRYPNVYADMLYDRIRIGERNFPQADFSIFWEARRKGLPEALREAEERQYGLCKVAQNQYLLTGVPANLGHRWECFKRKDPAG